MRSLHVRCVWHAPSGCQARGRSDSRRAPQACPALPPGARFVAFAVDDYGALCDDAQAFLRELADEAALPGEGGGRCCSYKKEKSMLLRRWRQDVSCAVWCGVSHAIVSRGARARFAAEEEAAWSSDWEPPAC